MVWWEERNEFCVYAKQSCFIHRLVAVILVACEVNDVSFSISAGANVTGLLCSAWRWGNPVEEVLAPGPGPWKSGVFLDRLHLCGWGGKELVFELQLEFTCGSAAIRKSPSVGRQPFMMAVLML